MYCILIINKFTKSSFIYPKIFNLQDIEKYQKGELTIPYSEKHNLFEIKELSD